MKQADYTLIAQKALDGLGYIVNAERQKDSTKFNVQKDGVAYDFVVPQSAIDLVKTEADVVESFWPAFSAVKEGTDKLIALGFLF